MTTEITTAEDIMSTHLITLREGDTIEDALKALINHKITGVPIVDREGRMAGVLSEYDLICQISKYPEPAPEVFSKKFEFSRNAFCLPTTTPLAELMKHFTESHFRRIPIVDANQRLVGIITRRDLMRLYFYRAKLA